MKRRFNRADFSGLYQSTLRFLDLRMVWGTGLNWQKNSPAAITISCPSCGLLQRATDCTGTELAFCSRCRTPLVHRAGKNLDVALACASATLLLLVPASFEPFLTTSAFGVTRTSILPSSALALWHEGRPLLALVFSLFVLLFPPIRFAALAAVLAALGVGLRPRWLGSVFRLANALQTWAMLDVFFLGMAVAYARLHVSILVTIDAGASCFIAAAVLSLITRAALDKKQVWRLISPDADLRTADSAIVCLSCDLLVPKELEGMRRCPRCGAVVRARRPDSVSRAIALLIAAILLYFPANLYPIATIPIDLKPTAYTVFGGIIDLSKSRLIALALLVFCASFAIPILKMAALSWCAASSLRRSNKRLIGKTRIYRLIEEIGRWSMIDPFTIACFIPLMDFNSLLYGRAGPAATPFAAVVILTILAVKSFDPRQMWDRAEVRSG
jgi:paraquat-inducible protein A